MMDSTRQRSGRNQPLSVSSIEVAHQAKSLAPDDIYLKTGLLCANNNSSVGMSACSFDEHESECQHVDETCDPSGLGHTDSSTSLSITSCPSLVENAHVLAKVQDFDTLRAKTVNARDDSDSMEQASAFTGGGYQAEFVTSMDPNLKCSICLLVLRDAMQTPCGHRFCRDCIAPVLKGKKPLCPVDRKQLLAVFPDALCQREVFELPVRCDNYNQCDWTGVLRDRELHIDVCLYEAVSCSNEGCGKRMERRRLQQHVEQECSFRRSACRYCNAAMSVSALEGHMKHYCPDYLEQCPNSGCSATFRRAAREQHIQNECTEQEIPCPLGCDQMIRKSTMATHVTNPQYVGFHSTGIMDKVVQLEKHLVAKDAVIAKQQADIEFLKGGLRELQRREDERRQHSDHSAAASIQTHRDQESNTAVTTASQRDEVSECASLERRVTDVEALVRTAKAAHEQSPAARDALVKQVDVHDLRLLELEKTSYNGSLIWKVEGFEKLLQDAKADKKRALYSPPFYTGRHGYKLCIRLYPNGDGPGRGKFLSLFFVVMAGEFDALCRWPFIRRVTMTLLDQSPSKRHISEQFDPDRTSSSFQKPRSGMNVASGCPCFVSHQSLNSTDRQYLQNDTLFLRISVDTAGLNIHGQ
ncbi:TNF receptor-associated factor 5-like [Sycon ciliatum]|uniref:TNF receptor-associated factor 5-like n=1 Tax=Sycon ciliatum TaxID=27933 RepID=UPI0031F66D49